MIKQIMFLLSMILILTGCSVELKKSANNKLFDTKGFDGSKRKPLYNSKYIDRAKRNVIDHNYDEDGYMDVDEPDEYVDPYTQNRIMYSNMIKNEKSRKRNNKNANLGSYSDIGHAKDIALSEEERGDSNSELKKELSEIRSMLVSAKKDLAKYKCPVSDPNPQPLSNPVKKKIDQKVTNLNYDASNVSNQEHNQSNNNHEVTSEDKGKRNIVENKEVDHNSSQHMQTTTNHLETHVQTHSQAEPQGQHQDRANDVKHNNDIHPVVDNNVHLQNAEPIHSNENAPQHHNESEPRTNPADHSMINLAPVK